MVIAKVREISIVVGWCLKRGATYCRELISSGSIKNKAYFVIYCNKSNDEAIAKADFLLDG